MATKANTLKTVLPEGAPAAWADAEMLAGVATVDKAELEGKLFLVTAVKQTLSTQGYPMVWVEVELTDGKTVAFTDSSGTSGVRAEVEEILTNQGKAELMDEWIPLRFICPEGLRVSHYEREDNRGKVQQGRSYYLTRSGVRA